MLPRFGTRRLYGGLCEKRAGAAPCRTQPVPAGSAMDSPQDTTQHIFHKRTKHCMAERRPEIPRKGEAKRICNGLTSTSALHPAALLEGRGGRGVRNEGMRLSLGNSGGKMLF